MAARSLGTLTLDLIARIGGFDRGMSQAERIARARAAGIEKSFGSLKRTIGGVFAIFAAGTLASRIVRETAEAERALIQLDSVLKSTGEAAGFTRNQLVGMADDFSRASTFDDDEIIAAQTSLLAFTNIVGEQFPQALQVAIDRAARFGETLEQSTAFVGRALQNPIRGLTLLQRQGVAFSDAQKNLVRDLVAVGDAASAQALILEQLNKVTEGAAAADRNSLSGSLKLLSNAVDNLLEVEGGLPELTQEIKDLAEQLNNPQTQEGIDRLLTGLARVGGVGLEALSEFGAFGEGLARWQADAFGMLDEIDRLEGELLDIDRAINNSFMGRPLKFITLNRQELEALRGEIQQQIVDLQRVRNFGFVGSETAAPAAPGPEVPTEEFQKMEAQLLQQIALFGEVGEAAKVAYQIASGQLDELLPKEQQRILDLSEQLDALTKRAEAEKEAARVAKEAAEEQERAFERSQQAFLSTEASLNQQLILTGEVTELERLRYEFQIGALQELNAGQREWLESLAKEVDLQNQRTEMEEKVKQVVSDTLSPLEKYQQRIAELNALLEESQLLLGSSGLSFEAYRRAVEQAQKELEAATEETNQFMVDAARGTQGIIGDTLFGAMENKIVDIEEAFMTMLSQMVAQALAANLAEKLFGTDFKGGGWLDSLFSFGASLFGRAGGGAVSSGSLYRVNETGVETLRIPGREDYLMMGPRSGQVMAAGWGGGGGSNSITVINNLPDDVGITRRTGTQLAEDTSRRIRHAMRHQ